MEEIGWKFYPYLKEIYKRPTSEPAANFFGFLAIGSPVLFGEITNK